MKHLKHKRTWKQVPHTRVRNNKSFPAGRGKVKRTCYKNYGSIWNESFKLREFIKENPTLKIVTHTDLDGLASARMIKKLADKLGSKVSIETTEPGDINKSQLKDGTIVLDLPYPQTDAKIFHIDHHKGNEQYLPTKYSGLTKSKSPSAAGIIAAMTRRVGIKQSPSDIKYTNKIDSANLTKKEVLKPNIYGKLSMALHTDDFEGDKIFFNKMIFQNPAGSMGSIKNKELIKRYNKKEIDSRNAEKRLAKHITKLDNVFITDIKSFTDPPRANVFKQQAANKQQFFMLETHPFDRETKTLDKTKVKFSVSQNIFNRPNKSIFNEIIKPIMDKEKVVGYGHDGIGGLIVPAEKALSVKKQIIEGINHEKNKQKTS